MGGCILCHIQRGTGSSSRVRPLPLYVGRTTTHPLIRGPTPLFFYPLHAGCNHRPPGFHPLASPLPPAPYAVSIYSGRDTRRHHFSSGSCHETSPVLSARWGHETSPTIQSVGKAAVEIGSRVHSTVFLGRASTAPRAARSSSRRPFLGPQASGLRISTWSTLTPANDQGNQHASQ